MDLIWVKFDCRFGNSIYYHETHLMDLIWVKFDCRFGNSIYYHETHLLDLIWVKFDCWFGNSIYYHETHLLDLWLLVWQLDILSRDSFVGLVIVGLATRYTITRLICWTCDCWFGNSIYVYEAHLLELICVKFDCWFGSSTHSHKTHLFLFVCFFFVWFDSLRPINNLLVKQGIIWCSMFSVDLSFHYYTSLILVKKRNRTYLREY